MSALKKIIRSGIEKSGYTIIKKIYLDDLIRKSETDAFEHNQWLKEYNIRTVLDIGANEGQFAQRIKKLLPGITLHCFEPLQKPYQNLLTLFEADAGVHIYPFALGDANAETVIHLNEYSPSSSFLESGQVLKDNFQFARQTTEEKVSIRKLDDIAGQLNIIDNLFIKIDVQGFEDRVIMGGSGMIARAKIIMIELSFEELYIGQPLFSEIYPMLTDLGFRYHGNIEQLGSSLNGKILQADGIFIK